MDLEGKWRDRVFKTCVSVSTRSRIWKLAQINIDVQPLNKHVEGAQILTHHIYTKCEYSRHPLNPRVQFEIHIKRWCVKGPWGETDLSTAARLCKQSFFFFFSAHTYVCFYSPRVTHHRSCTGGVRKMHCRGDSAHTGLIISIRCKYELNKNTILLEGFHLRNVLVFTL